MELLQILASRRPQSRASFSSAKHGHCFRSCRQGGVLDQGFTLIEIVATMTIVGILASIAIPNFGGQINSQHDRNAQSKLASVASNCSESIMFQDDYALPGGDIAGYCNPDGAEITITSESGAMFKTIVNGDGDTTNEF